METYTCIFTGETHYRICICNEPHGLDFELHMKLKECDVLLNGMFSLENMCLLDISTFVVLKTSLHLFLRIAVVC